MTDYLFNFPTDGLSLALVGFDTLCAGALPSNALGDRRDINGGVVLATPRGDITSRSPPLDATAWIGRPGSAARGDPARYYIHIRSDAEAPAGFDPSAYGMVATDPAESAAVLGVWAGDEVPAG